MEMVKDAATIDSLKKKLSAVDKDITLKIFF
jgi:phosphatidylinositol 4-kinase